MESTPEARQQYWEKQEEYALIALNYARKILGKAVVDVNLEVIPPEEIK